MGTIKDRNSKDPTEADVERWQEYIELLYKKGLNGLDNHNGGYSPRAGHPGV